MATESPMVGVLARAANILDHRRDRDGHRSLWSGAGPAVAAMTTNLNTMTLGLMWIVTIVVLTSPPMALLMLWLVSR
jgi:hypothetical protein